MCLLGLLLHAHPDLAFVAAHNRDEYIERPAAHPRLDGELLFCRDEAAGGTWLGLNTRTRVYAALTNVRDRAPGPPSPNSRGQLVLRVLRGELSLAALAAACDAATAAGIEGGSVRSDGRHHGVGALDLGEPFAGFNLLVADLADSPAAFFVTNRAVGVASSSQRAAGPVDADAPLPPGAAASPSQWAAVQRLGAGVHVLSNSARLNDAAWPKVTWVREQLERVADGLPRLAELAARYGGGSGGHHAAAVGHVEPAELGAAAGDAAPAAACAARAESALVRDALARVVGVMTCAAPVPGADDGPGGALAPGQLDWSPLPHAAEARLQRHVFLPPSALGGGSAFGTRSVSVVLQLRSGVVYYAHRSWDPEPVQTAVHAHGGGALRMQLPGDEAAVLATAAAAAQHDARGSGVAVGLLPVAAAAGGAVGAGAHRQHHQGADATITVAGLEWALFRLPPLGV